MPAGERLDASFQLRCRDDERDAWHEDAALAGVPLSEWLRDLANKAHARRKAKK